MADSDDDQAILRARKLVGANLRGKYQLEAVLGVGGMAAVYRATHRNGKPYAVKVLHPELSVRDDIRARFLREGRAANSIKHPGVVSVADDDVTEDGSAFLVMELLEGASLERIWAGCGKGLPLPAALSAASQLLEVLAATHERGIIHRDIKPPNVFVTRDGTVKVLDFGIARVRDAATGSGTHTTGTGSMLGTPAFMAPEQALANTDDVDARTDIWAVGATLFTLLSGEPVHEGKNPSQLLVRAATVPARPITTLVADLPAPVAKLIDRALAFDRAARWPDALAMRASIEDACMQVFGEPTSKRELVQLVAEAEARPRAELALCETVPASSAPNAMSSGPAGESARLLGDATTTAGPVATGHAKTPGPQAVTGQHSTRTTPRRVAAAILLACAGIATIAVVMRQRTPSAVETMPVPASVAARSSESGATPPAATSVEPARPALVDVGDAAPAPAASVPPATRRSAPGSDVSPAPKPAALPRAPSGAPAVTAPAAPPTPSAAARPSPPICHVEKYIGTDGETHFRKVCE